MIRIGHGRYVDCHCDEGSAIISLSSGKLNVAIIQPSETSETKINQSSRLGVSEPDRVDFSKYHHRDLNITPN